MGQQGPLHPSSLPVWTSTFRETHQTATSAASARARLPALHWRTWSGTRHLAGRRAAVSTWLVVASTLVSCWEEVLAPMSPPLCSLRSRQSPLRGLVPLQAPSPRPLLSSLVALRLLGAQLCAFRPFGVSHVGQDYLGAVIEANVEGLLRPWRYAIGSSARRRSVSYAIRRAKGDQP